MALIQLCEDCPSNIALLQNDLPERRGQIGSRLPACLRDTDLGRLLHLTREHESLPHFAPSRLPVSFFD